MSIESFNHLVQLLGRSDFAAVESQAGLEAARAAAKQRRGKRPAPTAYARHFTDPPTTRYKTATCLYVLGQGGPLIT